MDKFYIRIITVSDKEKVTESYFIPDRESEKQIKAIVQNCKNKVGLLFKNEPIEN